MSIGINGVENGLLNKGRIWISHGDNVITLNNAHSSTTYLSQLGLEIVGMGGVTTRGPLHTNPMTITTKVDTTSRLFVRLHGGYGFTSCGYIAANTGTTERYDDVAGTQTARTSASARSSISSYSLNGFGITNVSSGNQCERFDDVINTHTARTVPATQLQSHCGYSLNGYGFQSAGDTTVVVSAKVYRFDDVANTQTERTVVTTARTQVAGYSLNNYGFVSGGTTDLVDAGVSTLVHRFDDTANAHTSRQAITTARRLFSGYALNGYGFTTCGYAGAAFKGNTERQDDVANTNTARTAATIRSGLAAYSLNGFGFSSGGEDGGGVSAATQRFDDVANTHTTMTVLNTARKYLSGYSTNEYFVNYTTYEK